MMDFGECVALVIFLFPLAYSPGPGNAFFASIGATQGVKAAVPALTGYHVATFLVTLLIGFGFGLIFLSEPWVANMLSVLGAVYMFYLAYLFYRSSQASAAEISTEMGAEMGTKNGRRRGIRIRFSDGAAVLLLNPKAYYIIAILFAQFMKGNGTHQRLFIISTVFTLNNLVAFLIWTMIGETLKKILRGKGAHRNINLVFSACMVGVGLWMISSFKF